VRVACEDGKLSERRACGLVGIARGSVRYERRERDDRAFRALMKELAPSDLASDIGDCMFCCGEKRKKTVRCAGK